MDESPAVQAEKVKIRHFMLALHEMKGITMTCPICSNWKHWGLVWDENTDTIMNYGDVRFLCHNCGHILSFAREFVDSTLADFEKRIKNDRT
jgi:hypothetical protein